mmetsp:Transcript_19202/g.33092  ORF Transcript_19202/g.33092 Transcript_19202/m.33092 type:complete len:85 (-) Transcript_19202:937-1191(-)
MAGLVTVSSEVPMQPMVHACLGSQKHGSGAFIQTQVPDLWADCCHVARPASQPICSRDAQSKEQLNRAATILVKHLFEQNVSST